MPETVAEPPKQEPLPNPVIKEEFGDAKAAFRQQMEAITPKKESATKPQLEVKESELSSAQTTEETPTVPETKADVETKKPASVLPDDVIEPQAKEEPKLSTTIEELKAMTLPKSAKPERVVAFEGLKKKAIEDLTEAESRVQSLEKKLSEATTNQEVEKLREKLKSAETKATEIEDQWAKAALETSPQFQRQFVKREQQAIDAAKSYLEGTEVDPRVVDYAARTAGGARLKILEDAGLEAKQIGAVEARLAQYDSIQRDKSEAVENWREQGKQWQQDEQKRIESEKSKRTEFENKVWEEVTASNANLLPFRSSKDETWNSQGEQFKNDAREIFLGKGADPKTMADIVQRGVVAKSGFYDKIIEHLTKENKLKDERISKLESAAPGGGITTTAGAAPSADDSKLSADERAKKTFNEQLAKTRGG